MTEKLHKLSNLIIDRLKHELDQKLVYHNLDHTLDVMKQADRIAEAEGIVPGQMRNLLKLAAAYHDSGFLYTYKNHEEKSCLLFRNEALGILSADDIEIVCGMIMATRIPQTPKTFFEKIICDSDLDYLGRDDFETISHRLYKEFLDFGIVKKEDDWDKIQISFFETHRYFTQSSRNKREGKKIENLLSIKAGYSGSA